MKCKRCGMEEGLEIRDVSEFSEMQSMCSGCFHLYAISVKLSFLKSWQSCPVILMSSAIKPKTRKSEWVSDHINTKKES